MSSDLPSHFYHNGLLNYLKKVSKEGIKAQKESSYNFYEGRNVSFFDLDKAYNSTCSLKVDLTGIDIYPDLYVLALTCDFYTKDYFEWSDEAIPNALSNNLFDLKLGRIYKSELLNDKFFAEQIIQNTRSCTVFEDIDPSRLIFEIHPKEEVINCLRVAEMD